MISQTFATWNKKKEIYNIMNGIPKLEQGLEQGLDRYMTKHRLLSLAAAI